MAKSKMQELLDVGQSVWLDYLSRGMTRSGELRALIDKGLRGMTSNPTIFEHAIGSSSDYDADLSELAASSKSDAEVFETLAVQDVREATDAFRPVYDATKGGDGFVSLEVSPRLARDTEGSIAEARRLWKAVDRPNVMIKIPGTREGWPAIEQCLREGININITLLFSLEHYEAVANAYLNALEARAAAGQPIDRLASVASIFVSRVDTEVDKRAEAKGGSLLDLRGKVAVAGARLDYAKYLDITQSARWRALEAHGAKPQRLLWASTGTKNPKYSDVLYVETLIGPNTISTVPPETLKLFEDHGKVVTALTGDIAGPAGHVLDTLARGGIDYADVNHTLEEEGIDKFAKSYDKLMAVIAEKRKTLARKAPASARG
ncbi:MAG TPA: transaldolase [Vicinamibacterales bacterium]